MKKQILFDVETELTRHRIALHNIRMITEVLFAEGKISEYVKDKVLSNISHIANDPISLIIQNVNSTLIIECESENKKYQVQVIQTELP